MNVQNRWMGGLKDALIDRWLIDGEIVRFLHRSQIDLWIDIWIIICMDRFVDRFMDRFMERFMNRFMDRFMINYRQIYDKSQIEL